MRYLRIALVWLLALAALVGAGGQPAYGADFSVNMKGDAVDASPGDGVCDNGAGGCSLRAAVQEANALAGPDTISLQAGPYVLSIAGAGEDAAATGDLDITDDLTITGAGADVTSVDGSDLDRVFQTLGPIEVAIEGVTVQNGLALAFDPSDDTPGIGGGIYNGGEATLTLTDVTVRSNVASSGGGGILNGGTMTLVSSTIQDNEGGFSAEGSGGGGISSTGTATLIESIVSGNTSQHSGGGIEAGGTLTVTDSTISDNEVTVFDGGGIFSDGTLTVTGSTVSGNAARRDGGGILTLGTASVTDSTIADNTATTLAGGGILNGVGSLILTNTTINGNTAGSNGGGIANGGGDWSPQPVSLTATNVTISGNTAPYGGGIANGGGINTATAVVTNVTISGNSAGFAGGGILNIHQLTMTDVTISGNSASGSGGGIANGGGVDITATAALTNVTISGNSAGSGGGIANYGSDIANFPYGEIAVTNSTVSGNVADVSGGGIGNGGLITLSSTTVADNSTGSGGAAIIEGPFSGATMLMNTVLANGGRNCDSPISSQGHNLSSDDTCGLAGEGDLIAEPLLGPLADSGGPTLTRALPAGSPAIDAGDDDGCPATDQRGEARPTDGNGDGVAVCDIGAYEAAEGTSSPPTLTATPIPSPTPTPAALPRSGAPPAAGGGGSAALVGLGALVLGLAGALGVIRLHW